VAYPVGFAWFAIPPPPPANPSVVSTINKNKVASDLIDAANKSLHSRLLKSPKKPTTLGQEPNVCGWSEVISLLLFPFRRKFETAIFLSFLQTSRRGGPYILARRLGGKKEKTSIKIKK